MLTPTKCGWRGVFSTLPLVQRQMRHLASPVSCLTRALNLLKPIGFTKLSIPEAAGVEFQRNRFPFRWLGWSQLTCSPWDFWRTETLRWWNVSDFLFGRVNCQGTQISLVSILMESCLKEAVLVTVILLTSSAYGQPPLRRSPLCRLRGVMDFGLVPSIT